MTIIHVTPQPAQQGKTLHIFGENLGEHVADTSGVLISGTCAPISVWTSERIDVVVPADIGIGVREVLVIRDDGATARARVEISGENLVPDAETRCRFTLPGPGGGTDTAPDDVLGGDTGDTGDTLDDTRERDTFGIDTIDTSGDTRERDTADDGFLDIATDTGTTCEIALQPGACTNRRDCELIMSLGRNEVDEVSFLCAQDCVVEPDFEGCMSDCLQVRVELGGNCIDCYTQRTECLFLNCLGECVVNPQGGPCQACNAQNCQGAFEMCSGISGQISPEP